MKFRTVIADPPWRYERINSRAAAENHYDTMSVDELCDLTIVPDNTASNSHLYLWTTNSHLREGLDVMGAWGFEYKTTITWQKPQMGMGSYFRVGTELCLFGTKGSLPTLRRDVRNHFTAPRRRHSQKPREFFDLVRSSSPGPYLEVFARCGHVLGDTDCSCSKCLFGWAVWGNESGGNPSQGILETRHDRPLCSRCFQPVPKPKRGPDGKFCSPACRTAAWRYRREIAVTSRGVVYEPVGPVGVS